MSTDHALVFEAAAKWLSGHLNSIPAAAAEYKAYQLWPVLGTAVMACPACPACAEARISWDLGDLLVHLNDDHRWPRERIADWLDTLDIDLGVEI